MERVNNETVYKLEDSWTAQILKFNPYHDELGRFTTGGGAHSFSGKEGQGKFKYSEMEAARKENESKNGKDLGAGPVTEEEVERYSTSGYKDDPAGYIQHVTGWSEAKANDFFGLLVREWAPGHVQPQTLKNPEKMAQINEYINSSKPWDGSPLYRGMKLSPAAVDNLKVGNEISSTRVASWTPRQVSAEAYARSSGGESGGGGGQQVVFEVKGMRKGLADIFYITGQSDREVLCSSQASSFKITGIDRSDPTVTIVRGTASVISKSWTEEILKFNPNHDKLGRFANKAFDADFTAPNQKALEDFLQGNGDREAALPFDADYDVKLGGENFRIRLEGWFPDCMESRSMGKTSEHSIKNNYKEIMAQENKWKADISGYMPKFPGAEYGVSYIGYKVEGVSKSWTGLLIE